MNNNKEDTKWLLRPTQDSEDESDPVINRDAEDEPHLPGVRIAKSDLTIPCTEIPSPRLLRESGYVDVKFTHIVKHIIVQTYPTNTHNHDSTTSTNNNTGRSSTRSLSFKTRPTNLPRTNSSRLSSGLSSTAGAAAVAALVVSNSSNPKAIYDSHDLPLSRDSATASNRDSATASTYLSLSPMEHQPLTMPDIEDYHLRDQYYTAKSYFPLALCSCILCCPLIGIVALLKSCQVHRYRENRELHRAMMTSQRVKHWSYVSIILGIALWIALAVAIVLILHNYSVI